MKILALTLCAFLLWHSATAQFGERQQELQLTEGIKQPIIDSLTKRLEEGYVSVQKGREIAKGLQQFKKRKTFDAIRGFQELTDSLNQLFAQVSPDKHLRMLYSYDIVPAASPQEVSFPDFIKQFAISSNYGFNKLEIFPGNIGYMNILGFFPFDQARDNAIAAFHFIENTAALIVDLRQNNGGESNLGNLVVSYFFEPEPVNYLSVKYRKANRLEQVWSSWYLPGKRYLHKPVYIITSHQTFSAGEAMAFVLQSFTKATVIGERTGGGANMCDLVRLNDHMMLSLPMASPTNPRTNTSWETTGVVPDIEVPADKALEVAHAAALKAISNTSQ